MQGAMWFAYDRTASSAMMEGPLRAGGSPAMRTATGRICSSGDVIGVWLWNVWKSGPHDFSTAFYVLRAIWPSANHRITRGGSEAAAGTGWICIWSEIPASA